MTDHGTNAATVDQLVESFVAKAHSRNTKSLEVLSTDSAEWYVEAALNYGVAKAWIDCNTLVADTVEFTAELTDGAVATTAAYDAFNALSTQLTALEEPGVQHLAMADVEADAAGNGTLTFKVRYLIGSGYEKGGPNTNFPAGMALMWWQAVGNCSCGSVASSTCADKKIEGRVRSAIQVAMQPGDYFTNVETWAVDVYGGTDIPNKHYHLDDFYDPQNVPGHSNQDYPIYQCGNSDCSTCLDVSDLAFHIQGTYDVLMWIRNNHCANKIPYTATVDGDMSPGFPASYFHACTFTYGIKRSSGSSM